MAPLSRASCLQAVSRVWLVLVNIIFLGIGIITFVVATGILSLSQSSSSVQESTKFIQEFDMRAVSYGCLGGMFRVASFLVFYMFAIVVNTVLLAGGGFYTIYKAVQRKNAWASLTLNGWNDLEDQTKDFVQQAFHCCGYATGDDSAFEDESTNFWNATVPPKNVCVSGNKIIGCYAAGNGIYSYFVNIVVVATVIGLITCIVSGLAANAARKRRALAMNSSHRLHLRYASGRRLNDRDRTKEMFDFAWNKYMSFGFPADELDPIHCRGRSRDPNPANWNVNDVLGGYSLTLIDSLDTLAIMGNKQEFDKAVRLVIKHVHFHLDVRVQVFEVTIRVLGGLLSAHLLATNPRLGFALPWYKRELLDMAVDLANRLMPAFDSPDGLPYPRVNLISGVLPYEVTEACTAGAGTLVLEFGVLSRLTGDPSYEEAAKKALFEVWSRRSEIGLVGNTMNLFDKKWVESTAGIGAGSDSFYEYLFKAHILLGGPDYLPIFEDAYLAIKRWIMDGNGFIYKNVNMENGQLAAAWIDSLAAFFPGLQVLAGDVDYAIRPHLLYFTIWEKYSALPERFNFQTQDTAIESYPLRPELIESTYMLYQATKNPYYLRVGERILEDLVKYSKVECGFVGIQDVRTKEKSERMESFFLSETLKYLYLLFDQGNWRP
ncbi:ER degradation-enhancing alpha-mannosidase-like protein 1 [Kappamyces sp. JEL0680]|nr:ER degradation-enhancing alpha-mannosidase-like protein 1 [Kappamyces sp. JEL0680]